MNYGSIESFSAALQGGTEKLCEKTGATLSPIGKAFLLAYKGGITDLYYSDSKHPSRKGSYLKSCVNYLVLSGKKFEGTVPDCGLNATAAKQLQEYAEKAVFGE